MIFMALKEWFAFFMMAVVLATVLLPLQSATIPPLPGIAGHGKKITVFM